MLVSFFAESIYTHIHFIYKGKNSGGCYNKYLSIYSNNNSAVFVEKPVSVLKTCISWGFRNTQPTECWNIIYIIFKPLGIVNKMLYILDRITKQKKIVANNKKKKHIRT